MAFIRRNFAALGGQSTAGAAPQLFSYKTADALTVVRVAGYFNDVRALLRIGDIIEVLVVTNLGLSNEAIAGGGRTLVKDKSATEVDVVDFFGTYAVTDTD